MTPALWNLYFRERVNLGASLCSKDTAPVNTAARSRDIDVALAAADLYHKLEHGTYTHRGKKRKLEGDVSKLAFADSVTKQQRQILAHIRFRCSAIPGTQDMRVKIGHVGFWAAVVYGNGIFITISPGERHNYLAIRLSRYREEDPFLTANIANSEKQDRGPQLISRAWRRVAKMLSR